MKGLWLVPFLALAGCATAPPSGPGVLVLPGTGKTFDAFRADDYECRQFASGQVGGKTPQDAANQSAVSSAAIGTAVGAATGALVGGSQGAAVGAGLGLGGGALVGSDTGAYSGRSLQQRYDFGYTQCMYAKGNKVPVAGRYADSARPSSRRSASAPPPPPGSPPPPPSSVVN